MCYAGLGIFLEVCTSSCCVLWPGLCSPNSLPWPPSSLWVGDGGIVPGSDIMSSGDRVATGSMPNFPPHSPGQGGGGITLIGTINIRVFHKKGGCTRK